MIQQISQGLVAVEAHPALLCIAPFSQGNTRLDSETSNLITDCDQRTWCTEAGTCQNKTCRHDEVSSSVSLESLVSIILGYAVTCPMNHANSYI